MTAAIYPVLLAWSLFGGDPAPTPVSAPTPVIDTNKLVQAAVEKAVTAATEKIAKAAAEKMEAEEKAEKLRAEAKAEAEKLRQEAREDAEKLRLEAREDAKTARTEAKEAADKAKAEADLLLKRIETRIFKLNHVSAADVAASFNSMWSGDFGVTWKVSQMAVPFPESNSVMVTAPRIVLEACEKSLRELDVEAQQVYIEARFVELSNNASHKLGIDWSMLEGMKGSLALNAGYNERKMQGVSEYDSKDNTYKLTSAAANSGPQSANLSHVNATIGMSELYVILRALEQTEDARTFSNPKIIVSSGKKATVDMTEKYPNVAISAKRTTSGTGSDSIDLSMNMAAIPGEDKFMFAKEAFFSWGIELEVTPRISTNGLINVSIVPTISSLSDWVTAGASDTSTKESNAGTISAKYPVINVQRLITEFSMSSGTTAVIGGLSRTVERQVDSGIPWLRDWWWIGPRLFGSKQRIKEQKEIIVFVTVGLVDPRSVSEDVGLPKNAVLGRQITKGQKLEPGDRPEKNMEGIESLDLRLLEEQARDPLLQNPKKMFKFDDYIPFTKDPNYQHGETQK